MTEELDPNKIAVEFLQQNLEKFMGTAKGILKAAKDQVRLHLNVTYKEYIKAILERHAKAKSFFIRNEAVYLYDFYVPLDLIARPKKLTTPGIKNVVKVSPYSIITGSAGVGKSMLMRHLLINSLYEKEKIPVFVELRQLNHGNDNVRKTIKKVLVANKLQIDDKYIEKALEYGHFAIFLDGFDEVNLNKRQDVGHEIQSFSDKYSNNWIIVSSRPDNLLEGWHRFTKFEIAPLSLISGAGAH